MVSSLTPPSAFGQQHLTLGKDSRENCYILQAEQFFPLPLERLFEFFANAENLELITPAFVSFKILTPTPISMHVGQVIDYRIKIHGLAVRWRTLISAWEPPFRFVDEQLKGPYRQWIHEHTFEEVPKGTIVRDRVKYRVPLGGIIHKLFVKNDVRKIFEFRGQKLIELFATA